MIITSSNSRFLLTTRLCCPLELSKGLLWSQVLTSASTSYLNVGQDSFFLQRLDVEGLESVDLVVGGLRLVQVQLVREVLGEFVSRRWSVQSRGRPVHSGKSKSGRLGSMGRMGSMRMGRLDSRRLRLNSLLPKLFSVLPENYYTDYESWSRNVTKTWLVKNDRMRNKLGRSVMLTLFAGQLTETWMKANTAAGIKATKPSFSQDP